MKNALLLPVLFIAAINLSSSCKKNKCTEPICQLPQPTQVGANTMGCLVNGEPWLPDTRDNGGIPTLKPMNVAFLSSTEIYFRFYRQVNPVNQAVQFYINNFSGTGTYSMNTTSRLIGVPGSFGSLENHFNFSNIFTTTSKEYVTNESHPGKLTITYYDPASRIISGYFEFKAVNIAAGFDVITVTDGRFDCSIK